MDLPRKAEAQKQEDNMVVAEVRWKKGGKH